jgi:hypothetical protein
MLSSNSVLAYGRNGGENAPESLERIAMLEEKFIYRNKGRTEEIRMKMHLTS